ncbi:MAG: DUF4372 domain-containing protein [Endozoicomonadaceae bacterium]|nr:DUF4372 domain-containing protein [Endozoicomonadaceae bacterium]
MCWGQLLVMRFSQVIGRKSLRDIDVSFNSKNAHHSHLGTKVISRSSLSDANHRIVVFIEINEGICLFRLLIMNVFLLKFN